MRAAPASSPVVSVVRIRPLSAHEHEHGSANVLHVNHNQISLDSAALERNGRADWLDDGSFAVDRFFDPSALTSQVYTAVAPLISLLLDGINCTLLALGQTSSGKTHSMIGTLDAPGIMLLAAEDVLSRISLARRRACAGLHASLGALPASGGSLSVRVSCCEVYNEQCNDLLSSRSNLRLYEHAIGGGPGVVVADLSSHAVASVTDVARLLHAAKAKRRVGSTLSNDRSSRSHLLFSLTVHVDGEQSSGADPAAGLCTSPCRPRLSTDGANACAEAVPRAGRVLSTLQLVDLAGSERVQRTSSEEQREESSYINRSLLTLGTIISRLSERASTAGNSDIDRPTTSLDRSASVGSATSSHSRPASRTSSRTNSPRQGRGGHLPYRYSKLTRLLQPSLSGNARMRALCTVSPASSAADETLNTLRFATRIKRVVSGRRRTPRPRKHRQRSSRHSAVR
jgi:centromeric protein E